MPNIVKSKVTGLLRGLLRRFDDGETKNLQPPTPTRPATSPAAVPVAPPAAAIPSRTPASFSPATPTAKAAVGGALQLPLQPVIAALPMELRAKIIQPPPPEATFSVPLDKVLSQLAHGAVKITFGELRQAVPGLFINSGGENDPRPVTLPLNVILAQLNPSMLTRRSSQKVEVADEITGPFGTKAEGVNFSTGPAKPAPMPLPKGSGEPAVPAVPVPVTPPPAFVPRTTPPPVPAANLRPATPTVPAPVRPVTPSVPTAARPAPPLPAKPAPPAPAKLAATPPLPAAATPAPAPTMAAAPVIPQAPAMPLTPAHVPAPAAPVPFPEPTTPAVEPGTPIPFSLTPTAPSGGGFNSAPRIPIQAEASIPMPLSALLENWPDALKMEVVQAGLSGAQVDLPVTFVEPGLKRGRIVIAWKSLRNLIQPTPPPASIHDALEVELPLKVVAPLFFSSQKAARQPKQKLAVSAEIPNLFSGSKHSEPAMAPLPPVTPPPAPAAGPSSAASSWGDLFIASSTVKTATASTVGAPTASPTAAAPALRPADTNTNYFSKSETGGMSDTEFRRQASPGTDFLTRGASPKEIIAQTVALPGVTGAVIALPDGLKVASQVPAEFNADMLAAFLPQIFARTGQSTKELRMGELNNLSFTVGNVPWKIFRVNAVYFAAFGRPGEPLPTAQLASLAVLLDRKNK